MALIQCPDCEKMISARANQCPFCGCPAEFFLMDTDDSANKEYPSNKKKNIQIEENLNLETESPSIDEDQECTEELPIELNNNLPAALTEKDDIVFGYKTEQFPNPNKYPFTVIIDPERESDRHAMGQTHVMFRVGTSKYLTVLKDHLFYAPIEKEVEKKRETATEEFHQYMTDVSSLGGMTSEASRKANNILFDYCQFLIKKLVQYSIYEFDLNKFVSFCGSRVYIENAESYELIERQMDNVDTYAQNLAYKRSLERSSRSHWCYCQPELT